MLATYVSYKGVQLLLSVLVFLYLIQFVVVMW